MAWLPILDVSLRIGASLVALIAGLPVAIRVIKDALARLKKK